MRYLEILDVREREGKKPAFMSIGTIYLNDNGKTSVYLAMTGRFYPAKEQQQRGGQQPQQKYDGTSDATFPTPPPAGALPDYGQSGERKYPDDQEDVPF